MNLLFFILGVCLFIFFWIYSKRIWNFFLILIGKRFILEGELVGVVCPKKKFFFLKENQTVNVLPCSSFYFDPNCFLVIKDNNGECRMLAVCKDLYRILRKKDAEAYNVLYLQLVCEYKKEEIVVLKLKINEISNM